MAVVIRKMWLYYRIPPHLLEVSRDLERETIEHEAAQMAQRDKPPSYIEVMEGDLRVSGYPPPDYEELSSIFRQQQRGCDNASGNPGLNPNPFNRRQQSIPSRPQSSQRLRFMTWYRTSTFSASSDITNSTLTSTAARPRPEISSVYSIPAGTNSPHSDAQPPTYEEASERARY
ncbi:hypothetical protein BIW11_03133 [Tropilaelaps mercedesae]|uniref:Uncharacterized protein n=1 Tax=Tropilaelaps mercedesae TaxID=418985 RepID=A0A1V9XRR3_9ACAR|nr:hypothetical protein BIW11_03133 [Tropilaelaps mercedesae]